MQRRPPARSKEIQKPEDTKRAVLLSILCSLALLLALALLLWLFYPRATPTLAGADGSGAGSGAGMGTSATAGSGGNGVAEDGDAGGTATGSGAGGDAQGESKTSGADAAEAAGHGATTGTAPAPGQPEGQPAAEATAPAATAAASPAPPSRERAASTPPPVPSQTPSKEPQVMALGNLKFTDKSASTGTGLAAGGPSAPAFFGSRGRGTKFVYIVDRSGSMSGARFEAARDELKKSIRSLRTGMSFHVIFYDSNHEEMPGPGLVPVTNDSILKAIKWIDGQTPRGGTFPDQAMERALELQPHTIWLLTDGAFADSICEKITAANPGRQVSINTVAFHDQSAEVLLKRIASENHGDYRFVPPPQGGPFPAAPLDRKAEWERLFGKGAKP